MSDTLSTGVDSRAPHGIPDIIKLARCVSLLLEYLWPRSYHDDDACHMSDTSILKLSLTIYLSRTFVNLYLSLRRLPYDPFTCCTICRAASILALVVSLPANMRAISRTCSPSERLRT